MPKISASSVAEHRARQREAIVAEAAQILLRDGAGAVTPGAVGRAVGLARSSVYEYFPSAGDLLAEVAVRAIIDWSQQLSATIGTAELGWPRLEAYVRTSLRMVAEGRHEIADRLDGFAFTEAQSRWFMEHHDEISSPLPDIIGELGAEHPSLTAGLVQGVVDAAARRITAGEPQALVSDAAVKLLRRGIR